MSSPTPAPPPKSRPRRFAALNALVLLTVLALGGLIIMWDLTSTTVFPRNKGFVTLLAIVYMVVYGGGLLILSRLSIYEAMVMLSLNVGAAWMSRWDLTSGRLSEDAQLAPTLVALIVSIVLSGIMLFTTRRALSGGLARDKDDDIDFGETLRRLRNEDQNNS